MRRLYTVQQFKEIVNAFRDAFPDFTLATDVICGFPGESRKAFEHTLQLIKQVKEKLERNSSSSYLRKWHFVASKYLRKFAFDKMIELEIPESIADFIEGRVPKRIGAKHYLALARQSSKFYPRYAEYIDKLKALSHMNTAIP